MLHRILTVSLAAAVVATSVPAVAADSRCANALYRRNHATECAADKKFWTTSTIGWVSGAVAALGTGLAVLGMSGGGAGAADATPAPTTVNTHMATLTAYDTVGYTDPTLLAAAVADKKYMNNANQYNDIRAAYAMARGFTGQNSTIAILDTGNVGYHGAAVKNLVAGAIAPNATVDAYQIVDARGEFLPYAQIGDMIASARDANIFNASWGVESQARLNADTIRSRAQLERLTDAHMIDEMVNAAARDAIFVWAAGNEGRTQSTAMAALPRVVPELDGHFVNVVAWDSATGALADYSNACGATKLYCITAPGSDMNVGFGTASGTSFAAPVVSAAIAVIREAWPHMSAHEITQLLFTTARDLGDAGVDDVYGWGMLDLERATRPVGAAMVPLDDTMVPLRMASVRGAAARAIKSANLGFAFFDAFGRAFDADLNDSISFRNTSRAAARLAGDDAITLGTIGALEFGFAKNTLLTADGFLQTDATPLVSFVGWNNAFQLGNVRLFQRSRLGCARMNAADDSLIRDISPVYTANVSLGAAWGNWTFAVAADDMVLGGHMTLHLPTGRGANGAIVYQDHTIDLATRPAVEYSATYRGITAAWVDNPTGRDEFYVVARGRIQF
ncbi:S8 family serine peptidase [bacterium]|nr:S8 family serine peptidase [bacterium]